MRLTHNHIEALAILIASVLTSTLVPKLTFLVLPYIFYKLVQLMPFRQMGILTRSLIVLLGLGSLNTIIGFGAWVLKLPIYYPLLILFYGLLTVVLMFVTRPSSGPVKAKRKQHFLVQGQEIFALIISMALFVVMVLPLFAKHNPSVNPILPTRIITYGGDNVSHLELFRAVDAHRGYVQDHYQNLSTTLTAKLIPYPQGWHLNLSIVKQTIELVTGKFSQARFLIFYHFASAAGLALLAYMFVVLGISLQKSLKDTHKFTRYLSVGILAILLFIGPFFASFALGFQTQIAALLLFLAELLILMELVNQKDPKIQKYLVYLSLILTTGIAFVWFFLWPIALATVALFVIDKFKLNSRQLLFKNLRFIAVSGLLACLGGGQLLYQILYIVGKPTINEPGYIMEPNNLLLLSFVIITFLFVLYAYVHERIRLLGQVFGVSVLFSAVILAYQLTTVGEPRYYYYKSTFTFLLLGALVVAAAISIALSAILRVGATNGIRLFALVLLLVVAASSVTSTVNSKPFRLYIEQKPYGMSEELADAVLTLSSVNPKNGHRIVAIGSCNREQDIVAMRLAVALTGDPSFKQQDVIEAQVYSPRYLYTFQYIKKQLDSEKKGLFVISSDYNLQQKLIMFLGSDANKITFVDLDNGHVPKIAEDCPNILN